MPLWLAQGQGWSAVDLDFHAAVQCTPLSGFVVCYRVAFARTGHRHKVTARYTGTDQVVRDRVGAFFREFLVVGVFTDAVGMPTDPQLRARGFFFQASGN